MGDKILKSTQFQVKLARRALRRTKQRVQYPDICIDDLPILFSNSFPKSGTHLLTQILAGFTALGPFVDSGLPAIVTYDGKDGRHRSETEILHDLWRLNAGDIAYGHLHATDQVTTFMSQESLASFFIIRDPRDVLVSHVHYITDMAPNHILHNYYANELSTFEERLRTSILGLPNAPFHFPDIGKRLEPYLGWMDCEAVLVLKYENLINQQFESVSNILKRVIKHGFIPKVNVTHATEILLAGIDPQRSPTFRKGGSGAWKDQVDAANKYLLKDTAGPALIQLGYEKDLAW